MIPEKWAEKSPLPPSLPYPVHANSFNFGSAGRKAPSLPPLQIHLNFQLWFSWQKSPPLFCHFMRDQAHITHVEYPRSPYYKSILRFLLSKYLL